MAIKMPHERAKLPPPRQTLSDKELAARAEKLADELADRPYGTIGLDRAPPVKRKKKSKPALGPTTVNLPKPLVYIIEDYVQQCKRKENGPRSVSAVVRIALIQHLISIGKLDTEDQAYDGK